MLATPSALGLLLAIGATAPGPETIEADGVAWSATALGSGIVRIDLTIETNDRLTVFHASGPSPVWLRTAAPSHAVALRDGVAALDPAGAEGGDLRAILDPATPLVLGSRPGRVERPAPGQVLVETDAYRVAVDPRGRAEHEPLPLAPGLALDGAAAVAWHGGRLTVIDGALTDDAGAVLRSTRRWPIDVSVGWRFRCNPRRLATARRWLAPWFDDSGWAAIDAGAPWEERGYARYDGLAVYRKRLRLPAEIQAAGGTLRTSGIDDNSEAWVDELGPTVTRGWQSGVRVAIPPGRAVVTFAIAVEDTGGNGGLYAPVELHPAGS